MVRHLPAFTRAAAASVDADFRDFVVRYGKDRSGSSTGETTFAKIGSHCLLARELSISRMAPAWS